MIDLITKHTSKNPLAIENKIINSVIYISRFLLSRVWKNLDYNKCNLYRFL